MGKFKYGMYNYFNQKGKQENIPEMIKEVGFDKIMLWWGEYLFNDSSIRYKLAEKSLQIGLEVENIHAPYKFANLLWEGNKIEFNVAYKTYEKCIIDCSEFKIPILVIHITRTNTLPKKNDIVLYRMNKLLEIAEKYDVSIALENLKHIDFLDYIFENINSQNLNFCYDSGHAFCYNPQIDFLSKYSNKLVTTHFHDNNGILDEHKILGMGNIDWNNIREKLHQTHYEGTINFECNMKSTAIVMSDKEFIEKTYSCGKKNLN